MNAAPRVRLVRQAFLALATIGVAACQERIPTDPPPPPPSLSTITVTLSATSLALGQTTNATASGVDQKGNPFSLDAVTWSSSAPAIASVNAAGVVTGVAPGTANIVASSGDKSGQRAITVTAPPAIVINEIESNGGTPGDWIELFNPTGAAIDLSGWIVRDNDDTHRAVIPANTIVAAGAYYVVEEALLGYGLGGADAVRLYNPFEVLITSHEWTSHAATTYGRCPNGTGEFITTSSSTKGAANDCSPASAAVRINEIESNGGTPGDWVELYNPGSTTADLSGFIVRDNDDSHTYTIPAGTTLAPGAFLVIEEAALDYGLGGADAVRLFSPTGTIVDSYTWTTHAPITYGRCPDGTGEFAATTASTKGAANVCDTSSGPSANPWPGSNTVTTADGVNVFNGNLSGLVYESTTSGPVLWAARNGPGAIFRLTWNGTIWTPDSTNDWSAGKAVRYPDGSGDPDAEGITIGAAGSADGLYIATERSNQASSISRNTVLRFDADQAGATLIATHAWDLTADLPAVGANLGIEAITWVPDSFLVNRGFFDEAAGRAYNPADYPNHGTGLFFVGVEANGGVYGYALDHATGGFTRVATIVSGFVGVMDLSFDRELGYLWALCDDGCQGRTATLEIDPQAGSASLGRFIVTRLFERPTGMPNLNNEGLGIATQAACVAGQKPVFWADDSETGGHAIRAAALPCTRFP